MVSIQQISGVTFLSKVEVRQAALLLNIVACLRRALSRPALLRSLIFVADGVAADDFCRHFALYCVAVFCLCSDVARKKTLLGEGTGGDGSHGL